MSDLEDNIHNTCSRLMALIVTGKDTSLVRAELKRLLEERDRSGKKDDDGSSKG